MNISVSTVSSHVQQPQFGIFGWGNHWLAVSFTAPPSSQSSWFSEFSISIATWCWYICTPVKGCYFQTALLHSPFNSFHSRQAIVTFINTNHFFPTINGFLDCIIPLRSCLMLLNMKLNTFSFINYPVLQHLLLKMLVEICNPKSSNSFCCDISVQKSLMGMCFVCVYWVWGIPPWHRQTLASVTGAF